MNNHKRAKKLQIPRTKGSRKGQQVSCSEVLILSSVVVQPCADAFPFGTLWLLLQFCMPEQTHMQSKVEAKNLVSNIIPCAVFSFALVRAAHREREE